MVKDRLLNLINDDISVFSFRSLDPGWRHTRIDSAVWVYQNDTVLTVPSVDFYYKKRNLLTAQLVLDSVLLHNPRVFVKPEVFISDSGNTDTGSSVPEIRIDLLRVLNASGSIKHASWFPEGNLTIESGSLQASLLLGNSSWRLRIKEASALVSEPRILPSLAFATAGTISPSEISLQTLSAQAGNMLINGLLSFSPEQRSGRTTIAGNPLDLSALLAIAEAQRLQSKDVSLDLAVFPDSLEFSTYMRTTDAGLISLTSTLKYVPEWTVSRAKLKIESLKPGRLTAGTGFGNLGLLDLSLAGNVPLDSLASADILFDAKISGFQWDQFPELEKAGIAGTLRNGFLHGNVQMENGTQQIGGKVRVENLFEPDPLAFVDLDIKSIDPGYWLKDSTYSSAISGQIQASFYPLSPETGTLSAKMHFDEIFTGSFRLRDVDAGLGGTDGRYQLQTSYGAGQTPQLVADGSFTWQQAVSGNAIIRLHSFDFGPVLSQPLNTSINGEVALAAAYSTEGLFSIVSTVTVDTSRVAGYAVNLFSGSITIQDSLAHLQDGRLESDFATGIADAHINLNNLFDLENRASLSLDIKNSGPLPQLTGIPNLGVNGSIAAFIRQPRNGELQFQYRMNLFDVAGKDAAAEHFTLDADGAFRDSLRLNTRYALSGIRVHDFLISSIESENWASWNRGAVTGNSVTRIEPKPGSRIRLSSRFSILPDRFSMTGQNLDIQSRNLSLRLLQPFEFSVSAAGFSLEPVLLKSDRQARLSVVAYSSDAVFHAGLLADRLPLKPVLEMAFPATTIEGQLNADLVITREGVSTTFQGNAALSNAKYHHFAVDSLYTSFNGSEVSARMQAGAIHQQQVLFTFDGQEIPLPGAPPQTALRASLKTDLATLEPVKALLSQAGIGKIDGAGRLRLLASGTVSAPDIRLATSIRDGIFGAVAFDSLYFAANLVKNRPLAQLSGGFVLDGAPLTKVKGVLPFRLDLNGGSVQLPDGEDPVELTVESRNIDLRTFAPFAGIAGIASPSGTLDANINLGGTVSNPSLNGELQLRNGAFEWPEAGTRYKNITMEVSLDENGVSLSRLSAKGDRGSLEGSGLIKLDRLLPDSVDMLINTSQFDLFNLKTFRFYAGADLSVRGTVSAPEIRGSVTIEELNYQLEGLGKSEAEDLTTNADSTWTSLSPYRFATADVQIRIPESLSKTGQRVVLRNKSNPELAFRFNGELNLVKQREKEPQLFGSVASTSGYARQFAKRFDVNKGSFQFSGPIDNPAMDVETVYLISRENINIYFRLGGTLQEPAFTYESDPPMDTQDIVSYIIFGRPFATLTGLEQNVAGTSSKMNVSDVVSETATAFLIEKAGELVYDRLGIDFIEFDNTNRTTGGGTTVKAGKYINEKTVLAIIQQMGGANSTTQFTLEHQLRRNLQLILTQSEDSRTGVDILWQLEY